MANEEIKFDLSYEEQIYAKLLKMKTNAQISVAKLRDVAGICQGVFVEGRTREVAIQTMQETAEKYGQLDTVIGVAQFYVLETFKAAIDQDKVVAANIINDMLNDPDAKEDEKKQIRENKEKLLKRIKESVKRKREAEEKGEVPPPEPQENGAPPTPTPASKSNHSNNVKESNSNEIDAKKTSETNQGKEPRTGTFSFGKLSEFSQADNIWVNEEGFVMNGENPILDENGNPIHYDQISDIVNKAEQTSAFTSTVAAVNKPSETEVYNMLRDAKSLKQETVVHTLSHFKPQNVLAGETEMKNVKPYQGDNTVIKGSVVFQPKSADVLQASHALHINVEKKEELKKGF